MLPIFEHKYWRFNSEQITDKVGVPQKWTLADCGDMLIEVLDSLSISKAFAIGHSWGRTCQPFRKTGRGKRYYK